MVEIMIIIQSRGHRRPAVGGGPPPGLLQVRHQAGRVRHLRHGLGAAAGIILLVLSLLYSLLLCFSLLLLIMNMDDIISIVIGLSILLL